MLNAPEAVQKQLSDAISLIGKYDFPDNWPNLLPTIIENFAAFAGVYFTKSIILQLLFIFLLLNVIYYISATPSGDLTPINGALETAHSLFRKYRYEIKSQKLWTEIKFVLDTLAKPLTELFVVSFYLSRVVFIIYINVYIYIIIFKSYTIKIVLFLKCY